MRIDVHTGFTFDARGRMLCTNEPREDARRPAPRLLVGHTPDGDVVRFNSDVPDALISELEDLLASSVEPFRRSALEHALSIQGEILEFHSGPAYFCPRTPRLSVTAIHVTSANRDIARNTYPWLFEEVADWQPCFAVVRDGAAVSICFSSRIGPDAAAAGVETLPEYRGRGYASAVTAAWATAVAASGRAAFYSTGWDNLASQGVARRLGLAQFGEHLSWR